MDGCTQCELGKLQDQSRLERIDQLRRAIVENTYEVSAAELARKIINLMLRS
jgi:anti-sigma28 factor (negative regulator of flagellin synthesis)